MNYQISVDVVDPKIVDKVRCDGIGLENGTHGKHHNR